MCSPHHHPILGPWSLQSAARVPPPLLQLRPRPQKQLPAPITTPATHTMSTCLRASLRRHPTTHQKTRRPSRPCLPPCLSLDDPSPPGPPMELHLRLWEAGRACSSPSLIIKLPGSSPDGRAGLPASERRLPASHTSSALGTALSGFPLTVIWGSSLEKLLPTEGLSGHSSATVQPCQPAGCRTPSVGSSDQPVSPLWACQAVLTFLPPGMCLAPESHCPADVSPHSLWGALASVTLTLPHCPGSFWERAPPTM